MKIRLPQKGFLARFIRSVRRVDNTKRPVSFKKRGFLSSEQHRFKLLCSPG